MAPSAGVWASFAMAWATLALGGSARAQEGLQSDRPPPPPVHTEDLGRAEESGVDWSRPAYGSRDKRGLYFRLQAGFSDQWGWEDFDGQDVRQTAAGFAFGFGVGGFVAPNFALLGELALSTFPDPVVEVDGTDTQLDSPSNMGSVLLDGTYYLMPAEIYFALGAGLGWETETGAGPTGKLTIGKEWSVSRNGSVGLALQGQYFNLPDGVDSSGNSIRLHVINTNLVFSASFHSL